MFTSRRDGLELALSQHGDCSIGPTHLTLDRARVVLTVHAGHGPDCRQFQMALRYCSGN